MTLIYYDETKYIPMLLLGICHSLKLSKRSSRTQLQQNFFSNRSGDGTDDELFLGTF